MERLHEFEIRMGKMDKYFYLVAPLISFVLWVITKMEAYVTLGIFFIQPVIVFVVMKLFRDYRILRRYLLHRATKFDLKMNLKNEILALLLICIESTFIRNITWYNVIIAIILGVAFEYLRNLIKVEQKVIIE